MTLAIEFVLVAIIGFIAGYLLGRLTKPKKKAEKKPLTTPKTPSLPADVEKRVRALVDDGHKIGALKELCDSTDLDLETAKSIIESMSPSIPANNEPDTIGEVRDLIRSGKKAEALKLYRESSGLTLKESEEAVDKLEKEFG